MPGEYPWVVRMRAVSNSVVGDGNSMDSTCTGSLIASQWVLLAAHCFCLKGAVPGPSFFKMKQLNMYIYYGEILRDDESTKSRIEFTLKNPQMVFFPQTQADLPRGAKKYDFEECEAAEDGGDIALIKLPKPIPMGPKVVYECRVTRIQNSNQSTNNYCFSFLMICSFPGPAPDHRPHSVPPRNCLHAV